MGVTPTTTPPPRRIRIAVVVATVTYSAAGVQ